MLIELAYGRSGLIVDLPEQITTVIEPIYVPGLPDELGAVQSAIRNPIGTPPLKQMVSSTQTVAISVCDVTRPMPSERVLPVILNDLSHVPQENITIIVATGTHRPNTGNEISRMLGEDILSKNYNIINHDAFKKDGLTLIGNTSTGIPVWLNDVWMSSDFRITTGFVEPHFFAGFSGGPKMVSPGLAGFDTIMQLHSAKLIASEKARWAITKGNPIHDAIREIAAMSQVHFSVDVTINKYHKITSVYSGDLFAVHDAACATAGRVATQPVSHFFDIVVTTNSGYPLDMNLYQAVKGMSAASQIVRYGGHIICVAECMEGIPEHGEYKSILGSAKDPAALLAMITDTEYNHHDQWQVQIQAQIQQRAKVYIKSSHLTHTQIREAHLTPVENLEATIDHLIQQGNREARICVLPEGPQTIPYVDHVTSGTL